jgi:hypothetical protein
MMLFQHDNVYGLWVLESEEAEATRTTGRSIPHHSAFKNLAELLKVIF